MPGERLWFGRPPWLCRMVAGAALRYYTGRVCSQPKVWLRELARYATLRGRLHAYGVDQHADGAAKR